MWRRQEAAGYLLRHSEYIAPWICLVVGVHFFPMAPVLKSPPLFVLGAVLIAVAAAAVLICRGRDLALSAVTGAGAGMALLGYASLSILVGIASPGPRRHCRGAHDSTAVAGSAPAQAHPGRPAGPSGTAEVR